MAYYVQMGNIMMVVDHGHTSRQAWRWYTYSFAHGNALHIAVNLASLLIFGVSLELLDTGGKRLHCGNM